jgi:hypothetical protein
MPRFVIILFTSWPLWLTYLWWFCDKINSWLSSSGRWHCVALIRTDVSEDRIASIFRVHECKQVTERSCKLLYRQRLVEDSCTLKMEAIQSSETSVLIRATRCHLPEDDNHHSHRRGNLKSYKINSVCGNLQMAQIIKYKAGRFFLKPCICMKEDCYKTV